MLLEREADTFNNKHTFHKAKFSMKTMNFYMLQENYFSLNKTNQQTSTKSQHNVILLYNILHFVLGSFNITLYLSIQLLQMPSLLFCIMGSLLNLPSFPQNLSVWYLLQRNGGLKCHEYANYVKLSVYMLWNNSLGLFPQFSWTTSEGFFPFPSLENK